MIALDRRLTAPIAIHQTPHNISTDDLAGSPSSASHNVTAGDLAGSPTSASTTSLPAI